MGRLFLARDVEMARTALRATVFVKLSKTQITHPIAAQPVIESYDFF